LRRQQLEKSSNKEAQVSGTHLARQVGQLLAQGVVN
jgi:hypothetical protein